LLFDRRGPSFVEEISLKAIMRTVGVLALIALLPSFGLAAFDDLVAMTVGTKHEHEYHGRSPSEAVSSMAHMGVKCKSTT